MAGKFSTAQGAPNPIQPGLGHCQGSRGSHSCSGHPVPGPAHLPARNSQFPKSHPALPSPFPVSCPSIPCPQSLSSSPGAPLGSPRGSELSLDPSPLQVSTPSSPSLAAWSSSLLQGPFGVFACPVVCVGLPLTSLLPFLHSLHTIHPSVPLSLCSSTPSRQS